MKLINVLLLLLGLNLGIFAQPGTDYDGPYPRITNGYGAFGDHPIAEIQFENTWAVEQYGHHEGETLTIRYASDIGGPMPTVLFASGWNQHNPAIFDSLLNFIASKGFAVVFTPYKTEGSGWGPPMYHGMKQAIDDYPGIIDTDKLGFFGHSLGAGYIYWLAKKFYMDHGYGADAKFLFSVAGWIGFDITRDDLANFPSDCKLLVQIWEEDDHNPSNNGTSPRIQYDLFYNINIPFGSKNYVKVFGGPDQEGYHYNTGHKLVTTQHIAEAEYNALDFWAIFRPLDAMMDYTFNANPSAKDIALGFDTDMGPFPDLDNDYNDFVFDYGEEFYEWKCDVAANPHRDYCLTAPLSIEMLNPLVAELVKDGVSLNWSTVSEKDNKGYEIQRSVDADEWENIAWISGSGNSEEMKSYSIVDYKPFYGTNYYRFKQIDLDGRYSYSNIVNIDFKAENSLVLLAPNPANSHFAIIKNTDIDIHRVIIRSSQSTILKIISNPSTTIDISSLASGIYFVSIQTNKGIIDKRLFVD